MKSRTGWQTRIAWLAAVVALLVAAGCYVDHSAVKEQELPADWRAALQERASTPEAIAGVYDNIGQQWTRWMNHPGEGPRQIRAFLWLAPNEDTHQLKPGRTVEVIVVSPTELKFVAREGGRVLNEETRDVEWDAGSKSFVYGKDHGLGRPGSQGPTVSWRSHHLYKGRDGNLYQQSSSGEAGPSVYVMPVSITSGDWSRWKLATP
jgi:hypothetical protein